MFNEKDLLFF